MNKREFYGKELLVWLGEGLVGKNELLYRTTCFLCLGRAIADGDISEVVLSELVNVADTQEHLLETFKLLESKVPSLQGAFAEIKHNSIYTESIKKVAITLRTADLKPDEYRTLFEELLEHFSDGYGRDACMESTPSFLNELMVRVLNVSEGSVYDAAAGLGGSLIAAHQYAKKVGGQVTVYGQEQNSYQWMLSRMRCYLSDLREGHLEHSDSLEEPMKEITKFDGVVMVPPFGFTWKEREQKVKEDSFSRFMFGVPSLASADWLFLSLAVNALKEDGKAVVVTTLGALTRSGTEENIRKTLVNFDYIECVIQLPGSLYSNTAIESAILVFNKKKEKAMKDKIQFINASEMFEVIKRGKKVLSQATVDEIVSLYQGKREVTAISKVLDHKSLQGFNLLPSKYVKSHIFDSKALGLVEINTEKMECNKTLGDIGTFYRGINITMKHSVSENGNYKVINFADVKGDTLNLESIQTYAIENNARVEAYKVQAGDIIISNRGVTKLCIIPEHEGELLISQNFIGLRLNDGYDSQYIKEYLESPVGQYMLEERKTGTSIQMLSIKDIKEIPFLECKEGNQTEIMEAYEKQKEELTQELLKIEGKLINLKKELYGKMNLASFVELVQ